jgi:hypothetical protein
LIIHIIRPALASVSLISATALVLGVKPPEEDVAAAVDALWNQLAATS